MSVLSGGFIIGVLAVLILGIGGFLIAGKRR